MSSVIVFGPTGQIGSVAAITAAQNGAKVWLAMRDVKKEVPGLTAEQEKSGRFRRVQADLSKPITVSMAVKTSGAKRAFFYLLYDSTDNMATAIKTLKSSGIESVVFLSSYTVLIDRPLRDIPRKNYISYLHSQVEANLDDIFGDKYVALRPGCFVTNLMSELQGIKDGNVDLYGGSFLFDNVAPNDVGTVAGTVLAKGARNGQKKIYVYGQKIRSIHDSLKTIGKTLGKDVNITELSRKDCFNKFVKSGMSEEFAEFMVEDHSTPGPDKGKGEIFPNYDEGVANVKLYTGRTPQSLEEWTTENKALFSA